MNRPINQSINQSVIYTYCVHAIERLWYQYNHIIIITQNDRTCIEIFFLEAGLAMQGLGSAVPDLVQCLTSSSTHQDRQLRSSVESNLVLNGRAKSSKILWFIDMEKKVSSKQHSRMGAAVYKEYDGCVEEIEARVLEERSRCYRNVSS